MKYIPRDIHGILLINKPQGLSSNAVLQRVKHLFHAKKAGHTGSLDPLATGMLPICFGEATKYSQYLLDADKCYQTTGKLGITTDTGDAMGAVVTRTDQIMVSQNALIHTLESFRGPIDQIPPMYSALKHQGRPLYQYARRGETLVRAARRITIHQLDLDAFEDDLFQLTICCSKGTYIRSLVESIGETLGVGAHVTQLHRVYTSGFENEPMFTLDELTELSQRHDAHELLMQKLLPIERAIGHLPILVINRDTLIALRHGKVISLQSDDYDHALVRLHDQQGHFVGLAEVQDNGTLISKRLLAFDAQK